MPQHGSSLVYGGILLLMAGCASYDVSGNPSYTTLVGKTVHLTEDMTLWKTGRVFSRYELTKSFGPNGGYDGYERVADLPAGSAVELQRVRRMHLILSSAGLFHPQDFAVVRATVPDRRRPIRAKLFGPAAGHGVNNFVSDRGVADYFALVETKGLQQGRRSANISQRPAFGTGTPQQQVAERFAALIGEGRMEEARAMLDKKCEPDERSILDLTPIGGPIVAEPQTAEEKQRGRQRFRATQVPYSNDGSFTVENGKIVQLGSMFYIFYVPPPADLELMPAEDPNATPLP